MVPDGNTNGDVPPYPLEHRRDDLPSCLGAHWEGGLQAFVRWLSSLLRFYYHVDNMRGALANARGKIEWLCIQERWNPEVVIMFGTAASYRRATVGSSHNDVHPDNPTLHTRAVRPHPGFVESLFFISFRSGTRMQVFEILPVLFHTFRGRALLWEMVQPCFFSVGPQGYRGGTHVFCLVGALLEFHGPSFPW